MLRNRKICFCFMGGISNSAR